MKPSEQLLRDAFGDADLAPSDLPRLDLYMDQILTLFDEGLARNKRHPEDKLLTKTMVNNYSKEHLILPVKGKKYSREQVMQLLCILNLKQTLALADIQTLFSPREGELCFEKAYAESLRLKARLRKLLLPVLGGELAGEAADGLNERERELASALALASAAGWMRRVCEGMIDGDA